MSTVLDCKIAGGTRWSIAWVFCVLFSNPVTASQTCVAPIKSGQIIEIQNAYIIGDSRFNSIRFKQLLSSALLIRGISIEEGFADVDAGQSLSEYVNITLEQASFKIFHADVLILNLGINDWIQIRQQGFGQFEKDARYLVNFVKGINPGIIIIWQEDYSHLDSLLKGHPRQTAQGIKTATQKIAKLQRALDESGEICLSPWAAMVDLNPAPYATAASVDGVHIVNNEQAYVDVLIETVDKLLQPALLVNFSPIANAGRDQRSGSGKLVRLNGLASCDANHDDRITYQWRQVSGITVELDDPTSTSPQFLAPKVITKEEILVFELLVSDDEVSAPLTSLPDQVVIVVTPFDPLSRVQSEGKTGLGILVALFLFTCNRKRHALGHQSG